MGIFIVGMINYLLYEARKITIADGQQEQIASRRSNNILGSWVNTKGTLTINFLEGNDSIVHNYPIYKYENFRGKVHLIDHLRKTSLEGTWEFNWESDTGNCHIQIIWSQSGILEKQLGLLHPICDTTMNNGKLCLINEYYIFVRPF